MLYSTKICPIGHSFFNKNISEHWLTVGKFQQPKYVNSRQSMTKYYRNLKILCRNPLSSLFNVANTSKSGMQVSVLFSRHFYGRIGEKNKELSEQQISLYFLRLIVVWLREIKFFFQIYFFLHFHGNLKMVKNSLLFNKKSVMYIELFDMGEQLKFSSSKLS